MSREMKAARTLAASAFLIDETNRVGQHRITCSSVWRSPENWIAELPMAIPGKHSISLGESWHVA
jgi:hypothetical protein